MTIGKGEAYSYIIINPGIRSFESRNPCALFVALSRAKSAGNNTPPPDCAWYSSVLVNEDILCHKVNTPTVLARTQEINRLLQLSIQTNEQFSCLETDESLTNFLNLNLLNDHIEE